MAITVKNVLEATKQTQIYDIVNAIRNSSSSYFKDMVPLANASNVAEVGEGITLNQQTQNEFIASLVNRIGTVIIRNTFIKNPLSQFKSGTSEMGSTIEEIFADLTQEHLYDAEVAESEMFKREIPNIHTLYHKLNRKGFYKQTIQEDALRQAFTSWDKLGGLMANIVQAMYNSANFDEYKYMKLLLANYHSKGHFKLIALPDNYTNEYLVEKARAIATHMTLPQGSRNYNSLAVHTTTAPEDLLVLMTPEKSASIDVGVLASAFNMDKTDFIGRRIILDDLGENPETGEKIEMILLDRKFFLVYDNLLKMTSEYNGQGLYWNYWLHVWQTISASRFANAVAFVKGNKAPISEVVINPEIREIKDGKDYEFNAFIREVDGIKTEYTVAWDVIDATTLNVTTTGITLTTSGAKNQTVVMQTTETSGKDLILRCTVSYLENPDDEEEKTIQGRSYITINR